MNPVEESRKLLDSLGLLSKRYDDPNKSPNFIGNKSATKSVLNTNLYESSKTIFISDAVALDSLRVYVSKDKKKIVYHDKKTDKISVIDELPKNSKGELSSVYGTGKSFRGKIDLVVFMGLFFSDKDGLAIYDRNEFGIEINMLKSKLFVNSQTKYIALSHDKLIEDVNSEHFMNTDNYFKANLIVTPSNIYGF